MREDIRTKISFVFCTDSAHRLNEFRPGLQSLVSSLPTSVGCEVIVVIPEIGPALPRDADVRLQTEIATLKESSAKVVCVRSPWGNRNTQRNDGAKSACGDWVYFLDSDVRFAPGQIPAVAARLSSLHRLQDRIALVSGPYRSAETGYWGRAYTWLSNIWLENSRSQFRCLAGNTLINKKLLLKRRLPLANAPFDPRLISGGEENRLATQLRAAGLTGLIDAGLRVEHHGDSSFRHFWRRSLEHERAKLLPFELERSAMPTPALVVRLLLHINYWPALLTNFFAKLLVAGERFFANLSYIAQRLRGPARRGLSRLHVMSSTDYWRRCFKQKRFIGVSRYLHVRWRDQPRSSDGLRGPRWNPLAAEVEWSIIVPCSGNADYLRRVLKSALAQTINPADYEIIVIDDSGGTPSLRDRIGAEFANAGVIWLRQERDVEPSLHNAACARNMGLHVSRGEKILFLDADMVLPHGHLAEFTAALDRAEVVQGRRVFLDQRGSARVLDGNSPAQDEFERESRYWRKFHQLQDWNQISAPWKFVCTHSLAVKRELLLRTGIFRPEFKHYGFEDCELGFRLFCAGARFELLKSPILHLYPQGRSLELHLSPALRWNEMKTSAKIFASFYGDPSLRFELQGYFGWRDFKAQAANIPSPGHSS